MPTTNKKKTEPENKRNSPSIFRKLFEGITFSETLLLASTPIVAYLVVFFYEYGYFSVWHIPLTFVSFDPPTILLVMISLISVAIAMYFWSDRLLEIIDFQSEPIRRRLKDNVFPTVLVLTYLFLTVANWIVWSFGLLFLLLVIGVPFLTPLFTQKNKKGYLAKLRAQDKATDQRKTEQQLKVIDRLINLVGPRLALVAFLLLATLYFAYFLGMSSSTGQKEFLVVNTLPERVVVWKFDNYLVSSTFNRRTKQIDPKFVILDLGKDPTLEYHLEQIGPLAVKALTNLPIVTSTPSATQPIYMNP